jgi:hypothetical protein
MVADGGGNWLSVATVAARLEIGARSVQRRCHSGRLRARLVPTATGQAWEIDPAQFNPATDDSNDRVTTETTEETTPPTQGTTGNDRDATEGATPTTGGDIGARYVDHLERENLFLRGIIEQRDRDAAELRAALRKALDNAPRQLIAGDSSTSAHNATGTPTAAPQSPPMGTNSQSIPAPQSTAMPSDTDGELDPDELLALCRRIAGA